MRKKALAALLAFSMLISNELGANVASATSSSTTINVNSMENTITNANYESDSFVYFDNSSANWNQVYAYIWTDGVKAKVLPTTLVDPAKKVYRVTVPFEYKKIIFKNSENGWNTQTGDLSVPTEEKNNCWKPDNSSNRASGRWYTYNSGSIVTPTPTVTPTVAPTPVNQSYVTVDFDNSVSGWKDVYAYVWNNAGDAKVFSSAYVSGKHVIFNITGSYKNIIFKNTETGWNQQTADLSLPKYTASADDKCFKPYNAGNKSKGTWGKSDVIYNRKAIVPTVSADKDTVAVGDTVTFTMKAEYETREYLNSRFLNFVYEDGTTESIRSASSPSYAMTFTRVAESTYVYTWKPSKTGKVKVIYNVSQFEDHGEDSQAITLNVNGQAATPTVTPTVAPTPIEQSYVTVDFDNSVSGWKDVYAYVWNNAGDAKVFSTTYVSGNHFIFNIAGSYKNIIFKNTEAGWNQQTADLSLPKYTASADDKCFKPYNAGNKSKGTWGKSAAIYNHKAIVPSVSANKATVVAGDVVTFTMKAAYENGHYLNSRSLTFVYEDGTTEYLRSADSPSYATIFTKVAENTHTYTWTPSKTGKVKVIYGVSQFEDHGEDSQAITLNVKSK